MRGAVLGIHAKWSLPATIFFMKTLPYSHAQKL
jgi:hypothetical protein